MRLFAIVAVCLIGCVAPRDQTPGELPAVGMTHTTSAEAPHYVAGLTTNLRLSPGLMRACAPRFDELPAGLSYWFDPVGLAPEDEDVLLQIAKCVTAGHLAGRTLRLVARSEAPDDGGVTVVEQRADRARAYLVDHGVPADQIVMAAPTAADLAAPRDGRVSVHVAPKEQAPQ